jgi:hypothetical protein
MGMHAISRKVLLNIWLQAASTHMPASCIMSVTSTEPLNGFFFMMLDVGGPPLWSSGQSSWLQIRRPGFDSRHYQKKKRVVGLELGPLSLVSTTEELLDRKVAAPV